MKFLKISIVFMLVLSLLWVGLSFYQLFNTEINFFGLKQAPISFAFFISVLLYGIGAQQKFNKISLFYFITSAAILLTALFSEVSQMNLFKAESILLLFFGAHTFTTLPKRKLLIFPIIYYLTSVLLGITILIGFTNDFIQIIQGVLVFTTTVCVLISVLLKRFN